jgi:glutamine phosphoribosylpyrophosphate amidotransferase
MGHTRMTTQGSEKYNYNNHPFYSEKLGFAIAHNGVIYNDKLLKATENLPKTKIETDSYIAVQLLEKYKNLNFETIGKMAEKLSGSFCFTILDKENKLYIVKGDNPMAIAETGNVYIYASTEKILKSALKKMKIKNYRILEALKGGEIIRFEDYNKIIKSKFTYTENDYFDYYRYFKTDTTPKETVFDTILDDYEREYIECLNDYAISLGYNQSFVQEMLAAGYDYMMIEDVLFEENEEICNEL